jgi:hypothetical protein
LTASGIQDLSEEEEDTVYQKQRTQVISDNELYDEEDDKEDEDEVDENLEGSESVNSDSDADNDSKQSLHHLSSLRFHQISVGEGGSCGVLFDSGDAICWGRQSLLSIPKQISGPIKQISVGKIGLCVIYEGSTLKSPEIHPAGTIECWGVVKFLMASNQRRLLSVSVLGETQPMSQQWVQVKVGVGRSVCAVNEKGRVTCWGSRKLMPPSDLLIAI